MRFKETCMIVSVSDISVKDLKILEVEINKTSIDKKVTRYIVKAFGKEVEKIKKLVGKAVVAEFIVNQSKNNYLSCVTIKNAYEIKIKDIPEKKTGERIYDENYE